MPFKSEKQRKWMWANDPEMAKKWEKKEKKMKREQRVKNLIKKMVREELAKMNEDFAGAYPKSMRKKFDKGRQKQSEVLGYKLTGHPDVKTEIDDATVHEAKKRDYKAEYKKYGSSKKAKKYRAELNAYNRKKGTYGNGDGKDASHKGGKIVGFEAESKNRGRREKSRLKKESKYDELFNESGIMYRAGVKKYGKEGMRKIQSAAGKKKSHAEIGKIKDKYDKTKKTKKEGKLTEEKTYETILKQLGGNKFIAMTGAKNLATGGKKNFLQFSIGKNSKRVTHVIVTLTSMDTYTMEFINMRGAKRKVIKKVRNVYADQLQKIFTKYTGMRTGL